MQHEWISIMLNVRREEKKNIYYMILWLHLEIQINVQLQKGDYWLPGGGVQGGVGRKGNKGSWGTFFSGWWKYTLLTVVMVSWIYIDVKTKEIVHFDLYSVLYNNYPLNNAVIFLINFVFSGTTNFKWFYHMIQS